MQTVNNMALGGITPMTFREKLKTLRLEKGFSEARLADESGVMAGALHTYAIGSRTPSFPAVVRIAKALGVSLDVFADCDDMQGDEDKPSKPTGRASKPTAKRRANGNDHR
jgi:transcriptional regulator with XRE-family HTH domain